MQAVREQAALAKSHGLFRAASAVDVTCIIAREMMGFGERSSSSRFTSLPEVAQETYFERLWCVYELAIHSKAGSAAIEVIPTWMPVYTVLWIITSLLGGYVYFQSDSRQQFDTETPSSLFFSVFSSGFMPLITYPIIAIPVAAICFGKLQHHKRMLDQMASFDLRNAKCTLETDRLLIEEQVVSLFDEALEPPLSVAFGTEADEGSENLLSPRTLRDIRPVTSYPTNDQIIDQFNAYVRGPLRDSVLESTGQENHISFKLCVFSLWPWLCLAMIRELGCDGADDADCEQAASQAGFDSVWQRQAIDDMIEATQRAEKADDIAGSDDDAEDEEKIASKGMV
eukprot:Skav208620  [mRNA]  locus=scaffold248:575615:580561:- [translate_table: standard]